MNIHDHHGVQALMDRLGVVVPEERFAPRHNIAPSEEVLVALADAEPQLASMVWGITPPWSRPQRPAPALINARAETLWDKPVFRKLVASQRTVIPVNGFYEWRREGKTKQPFYIRPAQATAMPLAGLYKVDTDGVARFCVVTTAANRTMRAVHDRMPAILDDGAMTSWLRSENRDELQSLLRPAAEDRLALIPVSPYVNNARNEGPRCIEPVEGSETS